jgi:hypothetical protein
MRCLEVCWYRTPARRRGDEQTARVIKFAGAEEDEAEGRELTSSRRRVEATSVLSKFCGQATKGAWWMPWQKQAMKDVASCDKPRRAASRL